MITSTIKLYFETKIQSEKNFIIEDIASYLSQFSVTTLLKFQYIRPQLLTLTIKINKDQIYLATSSANDIDYVSITNSDFAKTYYYFVTNKVWRSESTIELSLQLDVLNTYTWNSDYEVDKRTLVMREHKDRMFKNLGLNKFPIHRRIDLSSEGINPPLYKNSRNDKPIFQDDRNISWILYYRNKDNYDAQDPSAFTLDNPIECFIAPSYPIKSRYASGNSTINATSFIEGYFYLYTPYQLRISGHDYVCSGVWEIHKKNNGKMDITNCSIVEVFEQPDNYYDVFNKQPIATDENSFDIIDPLTSSVVFRYFNSSQSEPHPSGGSAITIAITPTTIDFYLDANNIDRTDSRNIKIIELPYAPTQIEYDSVNDVYLFGDNWEYDAQQKLFKLRNLNVKFKTEIISAYSPLEKATITLDEWEDLHGEDSPSSNDLREDILEGKIYHSDFYRPKFVYDSFSLTFYLESYASALSQVFNDDNPFKITFVASSNVISKFLFLFAQYSTFRGTSDYENVCSVSRNNEQVIYNSQYLNYIRNGYNYDLKTRQRDIDAQGIGLGLSALSTLVGVVGGVASGNYAVAIGSAVAGGISLASQSVNYAKSIAQSEQNLQQKLQESRMQSVSVQNADDIDLLNAYCDNKAKWSLYEVSPLMNKALLDMFYYCGYTTQEQKVPTIDTRYWFNFVQAKLVINGTNNIPSENVDNIIRRFGEGVTFFHKHNDKWDVGQVKENYESWFLA